MALEKSAFARPTSLKQSTHNISFPNAMPRYQGGNQNPKFKEGQTIQCKKEKLQTIHKELEIEQHWKEERTWVLLKGNQFLLHQEHTSCYSCLNNGDNS